MLEANCKSKSKVVKRDLYMFCRLFLCFIRRCAFLAAHSCTARRRASCLPAAKIHNYGDKVKRLPCIFGMTIRKHPSILASWQFPQNIVKGVTLVVQRFSWTTLGLVIDMDGLCFDLGSSSIGSSRLPPLCAAPLCPSLGKGRRRAGKR